LVAGQDDGRAERDHQRYDDRYDGEGMAAGE
jgi:hypothetical protein